MSLHGAWSSAIIHVCDTGFSVKNGVSLHGAWFSVIIHVRDTDFSVKNGVSLRYICVFFSFCQLRHMVLRPKWCVGEGMKVSGCEGANDKGQMADGE